MRRFRDVGQSGRNWRPVTPYYRRCALDSDALKRLLTRFCILRELSVKFGLRRNGSDSILLITPAANSRNSQFVIATGN